jgi:tetrahydromethanopterin S-methyltransferase subunit D
MKILLQARGLELGIGTSQIVAGEARIGLQQAAAQRAVGERCNVLVAAIGQDVLLSLALEQIMWRLHGVQRRDGSE